jgi:hypothetical protein
MKLKNILLTSATLIALSACNKGFETRDAVVIHTDDITAEGCGYLLQFDDESLVKPSYLPSAYQHDGMKIKIKYKHTGVMDTCNFGSKIYDIADIENIKRIVDR